MQHRIPHARSRSRALRRREPRGRADGPRARAHARGGLRDPELPASLARRLPGRAGSSGRTFHGATRVLAHGRDAHQCRGLRHGRPRAERIDGRHRGCTDGGIRRRGAGRGTRLRRGHRRRQRSALPRALERGGDRRAHLGERQRIGRRGRVPGGGRNGCRDGRERPRRAARWVRGAVPRCGVDLHRQPVGPRMRPRARHGGVPLPESQRNRCGGGLLVGAACAGRRDEPRSAG